MTDFLVSGSAFSGSEKKTALYSTKQISDSGNFMD